MSGDEQAAYNQPAPDVLASLLALEARGDKPTVPEVMPFVRALYEVEPAGGSLHVVLDDGNVGDAMVAACVEDATAAGDVFGAALARVLLRMSKTQRLRLATDKLVNLTELAKVGAKVRRVKR